MLTSSLFDVYAYFSLLAEHVSLFLWDSYTYLIANFTYSSSSVIIADTPSLLALKELSKRKNFASKDSGATIIQSSKGVKNPKAVLSATPEEYLILPSCNAEQEYSLIINLSEDVAVDTIVISNHEEFSDSLQEISFLGSIDNPPEKWVPLGTVYP